jgi:hypothetical protein
MRYVTVKLGESVNIVGTYVTITPEIARVNVSTTPVNGEVYVDGVYQGRAPITLEFDSTGVFHITFGDVSGYTTAEDVQVTVTS